ncbi:MAG: hypothetical protein QOJ79_309 [Actinomycetota bacterium]|nr:hypothetical protein [Actinomycetota bacterium]
MTHPAEVRGNAGTGLAAAFGAALVGALIWSLITITTDYKIGFAAIGIGLLVGKAVEHFGGGDARLPIPAALIALLGCVVGDLFTDIHFLAQAANVSDGTVANRVLGSPDLAWSLYKAGFEAMDLVFYAIAAYEGFRFAQVGVAKAQYARAQAAAAAAGPAPQPTDPATPGAEQAALQQSQLQESQYRPGDQP